ncbi:MAG TPA: hypothetical protein VH351_23445 [Bryobacteraceae bacterium]|jgi:hypothetical protein|nr:hypothetical protein [Bryobacteraceae bacterium]
MLHVLRNLLFMLGGLALGVPIHSLQADTLTYGINAVIDGRDLLIIQGNTLQWHHLDWAAVGRVGGLNVPTAVSSMDNGVTILDKYEWTPTWSVPPPDEIRFEDYSSVFSGLAPTLPPTGNLSVTVTPIDAVAGWCLSAPAPDHDGCGTVSIFQFPNATNGNTAIVDFNDDDIGGHGLFGVQINVESGGSVPEPSSWKFIGLIGLPILLLLGLRAKRRPFRIV